MRICSDKRRANYFYEKRAEMSESISAFRVQRRERAEHYLGQRMRTATKVRAAWTSFQARQVRPEKGVDFRTLTVWARPERPPKAAKAKQRAVVMGLERPDWTVKAIPEVISRSPGISEEKSGFLIQERKKYDSMVKSIRYPPIFAMMRKPSIMAFSKLRKTCRGAVSFGSGEGDRGAAVLPRSFVGR